MAEDGTLADDHDAPMTLPADARVGVAHPMHLDSRIAEVFADYEILQPFPQLYREVYRLTPAEAAGPELPRLAGRVAPYGSVLGLERRGWRRGAPRDAGIIHSFARDLPGGGRLEVEITPGMDFSDRAAPQEFTRVHLYGTPSHRLGDIDEILMSELIRDLTEATV